MSFVAFLASLLLEPSGGTRRGSSEQMERERKGEERKLKRKRIKIESGEKRST